MAQVVVPCHRSEGVLNAALTDVVFVNEGQALEIFDDLAAQGRFPLLFSSADLFVQVATRNHVPREPRGVSTIDPTFSAHSVGAFG